MHQSIARRVFVAVLLLLVAFMAASAQEFRGSLAGKVTDPNGAVLPGATVAIKNIENNQETTATTNDEGGYNFQLLNPGKYTLTVTAQGFNPTIREGIELRVADKLTLDVQIQVAGVGESVTTTAADAPVLETGSVSTGTVIDTKQISELPLIDGSPYQLATLAPGISYTGNPAFTSPTSNGNLAAFRANGATGPNQVTLDGSPNFATDGGVGFSPPSDATQEFKVQTNAFDAQQGYAGGATVNVVVKSGTNDFHGSIYEFNRDRSRTANFFFTNRAGQEKPERTYNRFGGSLGGPVRIPKIYNGRDKTFFLFAYERLKNSEAEPQLFTVPTAAFRQGDFSALLNLPQPVRIYDPLTAQATGTVTRTVIRDPSRATAANPLGLNIIPLSRLNAAARAYLNLYPLPNVAGNADGTLNYSSPMLRSSNYRSWITRIDHRISDSQTIFGKYYHSFNPEDRYNWTNTPLTEGVEYRTNDGASADYTATLSSTMILDVRANLSRFVIQRQSVPFDPATLGFTSAALSVMRGYEYLPRFDVRTYDAGRPVRSILGSNRSDYNAGLLRPFYVAALEPTVTQIKGNHTMKYGYDVRVLRENFTTNGFQGGRFFFDGTYTSITTTTTTNSDNATNLERNRNLYGRDVAALLFGIPSASTSQSLIDTSSTNYSVQSVYHGFFFQDDWRVSPKLTLNMGLRYELEMGLTERYNRLLRGFDSETPSPVQSQAQAAYLAAYNADPNRATNFPLTPSQFRVIGGVTYADENNRNLWNADKNTWQPRFGASYQLNEKTVVRGGFGIFMSPFRILQDDIKQTGFSASTAFTPTNDQGRTFVATLNNPFPNGLTQAFGSSLGISTSIGGTLGGADTAGLVPSNRKNAKFARLIFGFQRELPGQFVVEANFVTSWGYDMAVTRNLNFVPRSFIADLSGVTDNAAAVALDAAANTYLSGTIANPFRNLFNNTPNANSAFNTGTTITRAQSLLAFPQFQNVWVQDYNGTNRYNSLQLQANKRFARDFTFNATYTYSRLREKLGYLNPSDTELEDRIGTDDRPHRFTLASVWQLPLGRGRRFGKEMNRFVDYVVGGWQINGTYEWQSGHPILFSTPLFYAGDVTALESHSGENDGQGGKYGIDRPAFDTTGLIRLNSFSLRNVPTTLGNLRHQPFQSVNLSLTKNFNFGERMRLQVRGEALNAFNHPYFIDLSSDPNNASYARYTTQRNLPRDIQLGIKFTF